ncbi:hypothetical protein MRS44_014152 [Fusarium solani]|uniref:uncharacterized protein n=1 Tax=Fusarium solani TaxID=169388 RepID=UPI0032C46578|nr:hypothetical protein MRS44_014152 [Fusarium solani]
MVNRGKPSLGCFTCKDSRVENTLAAQQVQARVDKQRRRRDYGDLNDVSPPQPPIGSPVTLCSVFKLYDDYFLNSGMGIFEALPVLGSGKHALCFSHALNAAALASGAGQLHQSGVLVRARQAYGDAILTLRRSMQDLTVGGDDSILASLFVLGFFEVCVPEVILVISANGVARSACDASVQGAARTRYAVGPESLYILPPCTSMSPSLSTLPAADAPVQIMDIFSKKADPASLKTEFEDPWIGWPRFCPVDPIVQTSVDLLAEVESTMGLNRSKTHIINVADQVRRVLGSLDLVVSQVWPDTSRHSSPPAYFNGLLRNHSATSAAIAKSLYLTVRLHLVDALLRSFDAQVHVAEADDDLLSQIPRWLLMEQEAGLRALWEEVMAALEPGGQAPGQIRMHLGLASACSACPGLWRLCHNRPWPVNSGNVECGN